MNITKKIFIVVLCLVEVLCIHLTYKAFKNKPVILDDVNYNSVDKHVFGIFVEKNSYSSEADKYEEYSGTSWPSGYELNTSNSMCFDSNGVSIQNPLSVSSGTITLTTSNTAYCYLYFDKFPFTRIGTDSTTGLPVVRSTAISSEEFYDITNAINYSSLINSYGNLYNYDSSKSILLSKYNLNVGRNCESVSSCVEIQNSAVGYGLQSVDAKGYVSNTSMSAVVPFSGSNNGEYGYWDPNNTGINSNYGTYTDFANNIYDSSRISAPNYSVAFYDTSENENYSIAYYVEEYVSRLRTSGTGRLLTYTEANAMTQTQRTNGARYWLGSAPRYERVTSCELDGSLTTQNGSYGYASQYSCGVRPVIVVDTSSIS